CSRCARALVCSTVTVSFTSASPAKNFHMYGSRARTIIMYNTPSMTTIDIMRVIWDMGIPERSWRVLERRIKRQPPRVSATALPQGAPARRPSLLGFRQFHEAEPREPLAAAQLLPRADVDHMHQRLVTQPGTDLQDHLLERTRLVAQHPAEGLVEVRQA